MTCQLDSRGQVKTAWELMSLTSKQMMTDLKTAEIHPLHYQSRVDLE